MRLSAVMTAHHSRNHTSTNTHTSVPASATMAHPPPPSMVQLPEPGTPGFAVALVHALNTSSALRRWQVDGTLVAVLLLALMTRRGGVLLDVAAGGGSTSTSISMVARVVCAVSIHLSF